MQKKYKACKPEKTINNVRNILNDLDIFMNEHSNTHGVGLCNCRVIVNNDGLGELQIGTNGKGKSYEYSLASGYAEFLERIQNGYRLNVSNWVVDLKNISNNTTDSDLKKSIDDVLIYYNNDTASYDEIWNNFSTDIKLLFPGIETKEDGEKFFSSYFDLDAIPVEKMYSLTEDRNIEFPILLSRISTATSGLCCGNTPTEAILHGFCEIFERYATRIIYTQNLTPPTIPLDTYKGTNAYDIIKHLENENNIKIVLKDCSLGLGLPVIGILIIDVNNQRFNFKIGSEFVPEVAIERCLTEAYQTGSLSFKSEPLRHNTIDSSIMRWYRILKYGFGEWPLSVFGDEPSYPLWEFDKSYGINDDEDLKTCLKLCEKFDSKIYIRDNSFLGFPAYQIIVPSISGIIYSTDDILESFCYVSKQFEASPYINGIPDEDEIAEYLKIKANRAIKLKDRFNISTMIPFYNNEQLSSIDPYYVLSLIAYRENDLDKAYLYMRDCIKNEEKSNSFYHAYADYLELKKSGMCDKSIINTISNKYGRNVAAKIFSVFSIPNNVFFATGILEHFDFDEWKNNASSHLIEALNIIKRVEEKKACWNPDHSKLLALFK